MTEKEKIIEELKKHLLTEMACTRSEFKDFLKSKYPIIIEHLILILTQPKHSSLNHWKGEIYGNFNKFEKLKYSKKYPTKEDFMDCGMESCFESIEDQLEVYILDIYSTELKKDVFNISEIEDLINKSINVEKLKLLISQYFLWIIDNYNINTGVVDKFQAYQKMDELIKEYNK